MPEQERGVSQSSVLAAFAAELLAAEEHKVEYACNACQDTGVVIREVDGDRFARACRCRVPLPGARLERLGVPRRNLDCTIDSLEIAGAHRSVQVAVLAARGFVADYPLGSSGKGLLLVGSCGTGKTHLATAILRELVLRRGAAARFIDFRELFARLKRTYGKDAQEDERAVLAELFSAEVLVLDELGAARQTEWNYDVAEAVIDGLYRRRGTTVLTTNLPNLPEGAGLPGMRETLGDRIGHRAWSRLQEMCRVLEMNGPDYRINKGER